MQSHCKPKVRGVQTATKEEMGVGDLLDRARRQETDSHSHAAREAGILESDPAVANIMSQENKDQLSGEARSDYTSGE